MKITRLLKYKRGKLIIDIIDKSTFRSVNKLIRTMRGMLYALELKKRK